MMAKSMKDSSLAKIREPHAAESTAAGSFGGPQARLPGRGAIAASKELRRAVISAGRRNATPTCPIRHARVPIVILRAERDVLLRHIVKRDGRIPRFERIARIPCKVRRVRSCGNGALSIYRGNQYEIASRIVDLAAADGYAEQIPVKPEAVVPHPADKALLGPALLIAVAAHTGTILATQVAGERKCHLVEGIFRFVVVLNLDAVVGVNATAALDEEVILAHTVIVGNDVDPGLRRPFNLPSDTGRVIGRSVRLPAIDEPGLDLQVRGRKNLHTHTVKEPGSVGGNIGWLVSPIVEIVVAEQADVRHEDSRVDIDAVQHVEVISAICFRQSNGRQ